MPIDILLIEDNAGDIRLLSEALKESAFPHQLHITRDGTQALAFLHRESPFIHATRPDIIILDLRLPGRDGHDLLAEFKSAPDLQTIPVIIMTTSDAREDILKAYQLHANSYVVKPVDLEHFFNVVHAIEQFWFAAAQLPTRPQPDFQASQRGTSEQATF